MPGAGLSLLLSGSGLTHSGPGAIAFSCFFSACDFPSFSSAARRTSDLAGGSASRKEEERGEEGGREGEEEKGGER